MKNNNHQYDRVRASFELITYRLSLVRALYIVSVASNHPREDVMAEFHHAVGDLLEGTALSKLELNCIDKAKVLEEAKWLENHKD